MFKIKQALDEKISPLIQAFEILINQPGTPEELLQKKNKFCVKLLSQLIYPHIGSMDESSINIKKYKLMFFWLTNWASLINENLKTQKILDTIGKETGINNLSGPDLEKIPGLVQNINLNPSIKRNNLSPTQHLHKFQHQTLPTFHLSYNNKALYYEYVAFISGFWILFLLNFISPNLKLTLNNSFLQILEPANEVLSLIRIKPKEPLLAIPLNLFDKVDLITLFGISRLSENIFHKHSVDGDKFEFSECRLNMFLSFNGLSTIKHYLLLMVSGLLTLNYHQIFFIFHVIRTIISSFPIVKAVFHNANPIYPHNIINYETKQVPFEIEKCLKDSDFNSYYWILEMYCELSSMENQIWFHPEVLLDCIIKYCECPPSENGTCCCICHNKCSKWNILETENKLNTQGLKLFLGYSKHTWPNILINRTNHKETTTMNILSCINE